MTWSKKQLILFLSVTFGLGWILQAVSIFFYNNSNLLGFRAVLAVSMFAPFVAVMVSRFHLKGMCWRPRLKGKIKYLMVSWLAPFVLSVIGAAIYFLIFPHAFDLSGEYLNVSSGQEDALAQLEAQGMTYKTYLIVSILSSLLYAPWLNMVFAAGEEAGWRGFLYPMLKTKLGNIRGAVAGGIIWGIWHFPVIIFAGYEYGTNYFAAPFLGMFVFCIFTVFTGIIFDFLYLKTKCIWIPALAHGSLNAFGSLTVAVLNLDYMDNMLLGPAPVGIISGLPFIIAALLMVINDKRKVPVKASKAIAESSEETKEMKNDIPKNFVKPFDKIPDNDTNKSSVKTYVKPFDKKPAANNTNIKKSYPKSKGKSKKRQKEKT